MAAPGRSLGLHSWADALRGSAPTVRDVAGLYLEGGTPPPLMMQTFILKGLRKLQFVNIHSKAVAQSLPARLRGYVRPEGDRATVVALSRSRAAPHTREA